MAKSKILALLLLTSAVIPTATMAASGNPNPFVSPELSPIRPSQNAMMLASVNLAPQSVPNVFVAPKAEPAAPPLVPSPISPSRIQPSTDDALILSIAQSKGTPYPSPSKGSFAADALPPEAKTIKNYVRDPHILALMKRTAEKYNLPPELLLAISIRESGVNPGALNTWGEDYVYKTPEEAIANLLRRGVTWDRSFDCGVMQINSQHAKYFGFNILNMFDSEKNIDYAGQLLRELIDAHGYTWRAIGRYHTPSEGDRAINYATSVLTKAKELQQYNIFASVQ